VSRSSGKVYLLVDGGISLFLDLTKYGSHVYVLVRRGELRASKIMAKRLLNNPKIVSLSYLEHLGVFQY